MANNSFLLKGWTVTLVAALFALAAQNANIIFITIAIFPTIAFWILDAYFLRQEKLFRALYDDIRIKKDEDILPSDAFIMNTKNYKNSVYSWFRMIFSRTLLFFYGALLVTMFITFILVARII
jgi:hypothetical protein